MSITAALIGAAGAAAASGIGGIMSRGGQSSANRMSAAMAREQMAFQERMFGKAQDFSREMQGWNFEHQVAQQNTAMSYAYDMSRTQYQRGMEDMRAAGLNPILAYSQGGASAPTVGAGGGGQASVSPPGGASMTFQNEMSGVGSAAAQLASIVGNVAGVIADLDQKDAQTAVLRAQEGQVRANTALQGAQLLTEGVRPGHIVAQTESERTLPGLRAAQGTSAYATAGEAGARTAATRYDTDQRIRWGRGTVAEGAETGAAIGRQALPAARAAGEVARSAADRVTGGAGSSLERAGAFIRGLVEPPRSSSRHFLELQERSR